MKRFPLPLTQKIAYRKQANALRTLHLPTHLIDFSSNDYLGLSHSEFIFNETHQYLVDTNNKKNGATGSRLLSGNHKVYQETEDAIARFHDCEAALIFNSGYDANVGFFSSVPQRNDIILYDALCHASIRDGILMSNAKAFKYAHNDFEDLEKHILRNAGSIIYLVTESVFSMDGDCPNIEELTALSEKHKCFLIIDEAHALGVFGLKGEGLVQMLGLQNQVFARIVTFGKGLGCHGAAVLGSQKLRNYLVNFARSFIYSTGLSPHAVASILVGYRFLEKDKHSIYQLQQNRIYFNQYLILLGLKPIFVRSKSAIQSAILPGNEKVKMLAKQIQDKGFDVKAILSPTVPKDQERLRFCIHSYNTKQEIGEVLGLLSELVFKS